MITIVRNKEFFFQGVLEIMVLTNFEDENNFQFFQRLKQSAPPSFIFISEQHYVPSSLNPSFSILMSTT
jgi:hypothetical protein